MLFSSGSRRCTSLAKYDGLVHFFCTLRVPFARSFPAKKIETRLGARREALTNMFGTAGHVDG